MPKIFPLRLSAMSKYYYKKKNINRKKIGRVLSLLLTLIGFFAVLYIFFPLVSWQVYFAHAFAQNNIATPIPKNTIVNSAALQSLLTTSVRNLSGVDYTNAQNWFPGMDLPTDKKTTIPFYNLSIPTLHLKNAIIATSDYDLSRHLVNYPGTSIPPENGNAVIFGHSTLPQLFNPYDYKTIFANLYKLKIEDEVFVTIADVSYKYKIFSITVVDASETSFFAQQYDNSYITLITCTPPGTTWKRLVIKARLVPLNETQ